MLLFSSFSSVSEIIMFTIVIIISFTFHELAHGLASYIQGDPTAKEEGRLTLNPVHHIDPIGLIAFYLIGFGWAKPVPFVSKYYKNRRVGVLITSAAGPLSNLILAFIGALIWVYIKPENEIVNYFFIKLVSINVMLLVLNLIPLPPLDGSKIAASIFGGRIEELIYSIERMGTLFLFILLWIPPVNEALTYVISKVFFQIIYIASSIL